MGALRELFSDNSTISFGRVASGVVLVADLFWSSYIVYTTKTIPDQAGVVMLVGALYGLNKISAAVTSFSSKKDE